MVSENSKISKACEPCRRRKVRCDGTEPCSNCRGQPSACTYRLKARVRLGRRQLTSSTTVSRPRNIARHSPLLNTASPTDQQESPTEVYHYVAAVNRALQGVDSSQLFYGPSSTFAFIQQIHRQIFPVQEASDSQRCPGGQGVGSGLDLFRQRAIYFGVPLRVDLHLPVQARTEFHISEILSEDLAISFLDNFKVASLQLLPFFTEQGLNQLLRHMYAENAGQLLHPQKQALFLIVLAIGALTSVETEQAETLFLQAKREAAAYEDAVTLSMIQFSLLVADYQFNMGRPNTAYLHVGAACRKALAWGLNAVAGNAGPNEIEERQTTMWCLYYMETWLSFTVGRRSVVRRKDIWFACPESQTLLARLGRLADLLEQVAESIYGHKEVSLRALYDTSEAFLKQLHEFAAKHGLGSISRNDQRTEAEVIATMSLHNVYYHLIRTTFRPFLVAQSVLKAKGRLHEVQSPWFHRACQVALDAAIDSIVLMDSAFRSIDPIKVRRGDCFVIEASCALLVQNSLLHPEQHQNNLVYISMALKCLRAMVNDEPVTNVTSSIQQILAAVHETVSPANPAASIPVQPVDGSRLSQASPSHQILDLALTSAFGDCMPLQNDYSQMFHRQCADPNQALEGPSTQQFPALNFDILLADLSEFFPLNANDPSSA